MAGMGGTARMEIVFSPQARRLLERMTKALEDMSKEQKRGRVTATNYVEVYRDAVSGNFVTKEYAEANPNTTIKQDVPAEQFMRARLTGDESFEWMKRGANTAAEDLDLDNKDWVKAVGEAMGYVSVCWSTMEGAGTFESERARAALEALIVRLKKEMP